MAITFTQAKKRQKYLLLILALVILAAILIIWRSFFAEKKPPSLLPEEIAVPPKIEIDWQILKEPQLQEFQPIEEIPYFEGEFGRENPFLPY